MRVGILYSRVRVEEKLLFEAFAARGVQFDLLDDRDLIFEITPGREYAEQYAGYDVIAERCINHSRALYSLRMLNDRGIATVNTAQVADVCGNKLQTTSALTAAGIPSPRTLIAYSSDSALRAIESLGYPVVLKPAVGSWGRLLSKVNDREAAESILEHKRCWAPITTASSISGVHPQAGARHHAFVVGDETICAIYRTSEHWITNTARRQVDDVR